MALSVLITKFENDGLMYAPNGDLGACDSARWLFLLDEFEPSYREVLTYLLQIEEEGAAILAGNQVLIPWEKLYSILSDESHNLSIHLLKLPPKAELVPQLSSYGSLADSNFAISIEWVRSDGKRILEKVTRIGAILKYGAEHFLLSKSSWQLAEGIKNYAKLYHAEKSQRRNEHEWGKIRKLATKASARLDNFLVKTLVVTPETLNLKMNKVDVEGTKVVELLPFIEDVPQDKWIRAFDNYRNVQEHYDIANEGGIVRVILNDAVRSVLKEIKRMPGRRVAGNRAQAFLRNPYAVIGEDSISVIPPEVFERSLEEAEVVFYSFTHKLIFTEDGGIECVELNIRSISSASHAISEVLKLESSKRLKDFVNEIEGKIAQDKVCCAWEGYEFELNGDIDEQLKKLKDILERWEKSPLFINYDEVFDLTRYVQRITGIGEYKPVYSPYIARKNGGDWVPEDIELILKYDQKSVESYTIGTEKELQEIIHAAEEKGEQYITDPRFPEPLSLGEAKKQLEIFQVARQQLQGGSFPEDVTKVDSKSALNKRVVLNYFLNLETKEYEEARQEAIAFESEVKPELPSNLKDNVRFKKHQIEGISRLQQLFNNAPKFVRGCILADDMGLGKTLQLLTFIAWYLEKSAKEATVRPVLIVAPVSLLANWQNEIKHFFTDDFPEILQLYGVNLSSLRANREDLDRQLLTEGLTSFLTKNWRGNARIVLTTYETLRNYEFSFAAEKWGIMVCDEAQKIKSPSALVSHAAKKQNALFKIACTGTPVENSLADLWNLFDFIQPGFLGSLNEFSNKYRRPIEANTEQQRERLEELRAMIKPQIIRRMKEDIANDLPQKIDRLDCSCKKIPISAVQRELYKAGIAHFRAKLSQIQSSGIAAKETGTAFLALVQYLRAVCAAPRQIGMTSDISVPLHEYLDQSPKMNWLLNTLDEIRRKNEKAIIFTEFKDIQRVVQHYIKGRFGYNALIINGDNIPSSRQKDIDTFQTVTGFGVIILSTAAIGFGVNIQAANHVIHFTRPWNPAKEDQATDRAHRIGQTKNVYVYCPTIIAEEFTTFEERLDELLENKKTLARDMLNGTGEISLNEFQVLSDDTGIKALPDMSISEKDLRLMEATTFEIFCQVLWARQGYDTKRTGRSRDGGIDVVAIKGDCGCLIQCKTTTQERSLGWDAIKDVVAGAAGYEKRNQGILFKKISITNTSFNSEAHRQASLNNVELFEQKHILDLLDEFPIKLAEVQLSL